MTQKKMFFSKGIDVWWVINACGTVETTPLLVSVNWAYTETVCAVIGLMSDYITMENVTVAR